MLKLKLELVIVPHRGNIVLTTGMRIFDKRSYFACYSAIVNGALGRHSKRSFFLRGWVWAQEWIADPFPEDISLSQTVRAFPSSSLALPAEAGPWSYIVHPFFRKIEGELYLFMVPAVRRLLGITAEDVSNHVFIQNYGSHLPILP
jgi:hypothetical protein